MIEEYNGWKNWPTWRINLEFFDGSSESLWAGYEDLKSLAEAMELWAKDQVGQQSEDGITHDLAIYIMSFVDWREIAEKYFVQPKLEPEVYSQKFDYKDLGYGVELFARSNDPEKTLFIQGDDASQFLDEVANVDDKWKDGEIDICKNLELIDHIIGNYF